MCPVLVFAFRNAYQLVKERGTLTIVETPLTYARVSKSFLKEEADNILKRVASTRMRKEKKRKRQIEKKKLRLSRQSKPADN